MPPRSLLAAAAATTVLLAFVPAVSEAATVDTAPTREITGAATGLNTAYDVAVDGAGNRYVSNLLGNSITVYAPTATGNVAPIRTISGAATGLGIPTGVADRLRRHAVRRQQRSRHGDRLCARRRAATPRRSAPSPGRRPC